MRGAEVLRGAMAIQPVSPYWVLNRLRTMGVREVGYRAVQNLRAQAERVGLGRVKPMPSSAARGKPWIAVWPESFAVGTYTEAADCILSGRFRLFSNRLWELGFPPEWNRDPATGTRAPLVFGKTLNYRDVRACGNVKYLWELNRHLELVTLAQAWRLSGETRFALGCRALVESWIAQCPYVLGPNWTSSLELALRMINWSCAWHLLDGERSVLFKYEDGDTFKARWLNAIRQHCHFIAGHLSRYSSANNHLLGELLGLFIGSTTWPCWAESALWSSRAMQELEEQALLQNTVDGVNKEQAIWYQHEVADMMLLAGLTARQNGGDFSRAFWERLEAMLEFIASCMDVGGEVPAFGDSDDAVIVRFDPSPRLRVYQSLLATGSVLFDRGAFKHKAQVFDDKSRWLLGDAAAAKFATIAADSSGQRLRRRFEAGGYYVLGGELESENEVRIVVDAAPLGYLAIAAHGHADALSFTLSVAGRPMLVDPGTYAYHTQRRWRDYFRGTSAHNTVVVDQLDQSTSGGPFLWNRRANVTCASFDAGVENERIVAEHDGYCRLDDPVTHRREIVYERASRVVRVTDQICCAAQHRIDMYWHFSEECLLTLEGAAARATRDRSELTLRWPAALQAQLLRGSTEPILGWISHRFDEKSPTNTLHVFGTIEGDWQGETAISISPGRLEGPLR